jgi:cytochrome oxidase Cu insertion factor (SCO1/SenC/PrrC family)
MARYSRFLVLILLVLGAGFWVSTWWREQSSLPPVGGVAVPGGVELGGPFQLVAPDGHTVTDADFRGRFMLVYFGYTFCPDVCPTELQAVAASLAQLGDQAARIAPIFITIDPERDTPKAMGEYTRLFDERLIGLTGSAGQIATVAKEYRVYYARAESKNASAYLMDHSSFLYLMGPDGKFRALIKPGSSPADIAAILRAQLAGS